MIKIYIGSRMNLTLLAKAFMDRLFPLSKRGELYFEEDLSNVELPVRFLYFENEYYERLMKHVKSPETINKINLSNSVNEWKNLINSLNEYSLISSVDYGKLKIYSTHLENYSTIEVQEDRVQEVLSRNKDLYPLGKSLFSAIEKDLKRIYVGQEIKISRFEKGMGISIMIPFQFESIQRFPFGPIIKLIRQYNQTIEDFNFYKGKEKNEIFVSIKLEGWKDWFQGN